jgi:hypothetical protein
VAVLFRCMVRNTKSEAICTCVGKKVVPAELVCQVLPFHPRQFRAGRAVTAAAQCLLWTGAWHEPEVPIVYARTFSDNCVISVPRLHAVMVYRGRRSKSPRLLCIGAG